MTTAAPLPLTVAISTMDRPDMLSRCLESVADGTRLPAEVVVVDQSRDDRTAAVVERMRTRGLRIAYHRHGRRGLGVAQNVAVERASHPLVAVTDDDCVVDEAWVERIHAHFADPGLDVLAGRIVPLPPEGERVHPVASRLSEERRTFDRRSMPWHVGSGNNFAFRRAWYVRIGGCDERLGPGSPARGGVDMDLFYRLLRAGATVRYEPDVLVHHERDTWSGRRARRPMYGWGMGACVALRLREGDVGALRLLGGWIRLRLGLVAKGMARGNLRGVYEEWLMLRGTVGGVVHGMVVASRARRADVRNSSR